jgi:CheY-like chemotaxis protein
MLVKRTILFVDDEAPILKSIRREFFDTEFTTFFASSGKEALKLLRENMNIDVIVSDLMMPEMNGYELLKSVKELYPNIIRIVLSGYAEEDVVLKCINENIALMYINKPWERNEFIETINSLFESNENK